MLKFKKHSIHNFYIKKKGLENYWKMSTNIKYMKNRVLSSPNIKKIHNYSYYTDRLIGRGNFSTVYEAFSHATRHFLLI